jgi:hypothetical protein
MRGIEMKKIFAALAFFSLFISTAGIAGAQYYAPYPYYPYAPYGYGAPYSDPSQYDPYYELHTMHYQLYLDPYGYYYPYWNGPVGIAPPAPPPPPRVVRRPPPATRPAVPAPPAK